MRVRGMSAEGSHRQTGRISWIADTVLDGIAGDAVGRDRLRREELDVAEIPAAARRRVDWPELNSKKCLERVVLLSRLRMLFCMGLF